MITMDISLPAIALAVSKANAYTDSAIGGEKMITPEELDALTEKLDITTTG